MSTGFRVLTCRFFSTSKDCGVDEGDSGDDGKDSDDKGVRGDESEAVAGRQVRNRALKGDMSHTLTRQHIVSSHGGLIAVCRDAPVSSKVAVCA